VLRGYPLPYLLESTYAEKILLMEAMREYTEAIDDAAKGIKE
jgi:hypothetical protein